MHRTGAEARLASNVGCGITNSQAPASVSQASASADGGKAPSTPAAASWESTSRRDCALISTSFDGPRFEVDGAVPASKEGHEDSNASMDPTSIPPPAARE